MTIKRSQPLATILKQGCFITALALISACQPASEPTSTPKAMVTTLTLAQQDSYQLQRQYAGVIRARNSSHLSFELSGKLKSLEVDVGDSVSKGQVLARLDQQLLLAEQAQLQAQINQTQAELNLNQSTLERNNDLNKQGFQSQQVIDELNSQRNALTANLNRLQASLKGNHLRLEKSILVAPFAGVITQRQADPSQVVAPSTQIVSLVDPTTAEAYIGVPQKSAAKLGIGQQLKILINDAQVTGKVAGISQQLSSGSRTQTVRISLPSDVITVNGQLVTMEMDHLQQVPGFWVPSDALINGIRGRWNVFVVKPQDGDLTIQRRDVDILYANQQRAYIQGAISDGEQIVSQGLHRLVAGQLVEIAREDIQP
ncbi:efflux RND transporter periplasmic adaptor subunit [Paraferrimonas haliotis]|uniref:efflux RND transporter periplasmic adaptor subunit n=1 Tax=Paraferrimonas haliotis TaxID=2013866 RepID=UPI000BA9378A|nr:efflux RND transporter periplasmic adaptor subunit [Paraferrimonas haliotis]